MYYADLADEFAHHLGQIPCPFDLYASTSDEKSRQAVAKIFNTIPNAQLVDVRVVPNIGRDIAPFVVEFGQDLANYDIVSHIQTKKSLYNNGSTDGWRESILTSLFEDPARIALYLRTLQTRRYGIIYPQCFYNLPYMANTWLANSGIARAWAPRFEVGKLPDGYFDFPAGSMFWARTDAIRPLLEAGLQWSDFPPEQGQTDGTLAHCIERMLGVVPTSRHYLHGVIRDTRTPSWSRWRLNQFIDRPLEHIHAAITAPETRVVAFDIFDTLLTRPLLDADNVKVLLHAEHEKTGLSGFRDVRVSSEGAAREAKGRDVDIHDIYAHLAGALNGSGLPLTPAREIELETLSVRPRREVVALLDFAARQRKKVILASDMFLPRDAIETMLERCGVKGWHTLYLSSEIGLRKDSGKLYNHILKQEAINPSQMVMVGDNERSDFQIPADMGIRTIHVVKPQNIMRAMPRFADIVPNADDASTADQFLFGTIASENFGAITYPDFSPDDMFGASARAIGYGLLGPITVAFSQWLLDQAHENGVNRLYFLAREGKFLKTIFDHWQEGLANRAGPRKGIVGSEYLLISRRAVTVPCIQTIEDIFAIAAANDFYGAPMAMFLEERFGTVLDEAAWIQCERKGLWSRSKPLTINAGNIDHIRPFLKSIAPHIYREASVERTNALGYYDQMGLAADTNSAVVDVGYGATIQRHLMKLLGQKVHGLYMMTDCNGAALGANASVLSKGCFVHGAERLPTASPLFLHSFILEKMLSADDEQVIRYTPAGDAEFRENANYVDLGRKVRQEIQQGALEFAAEAVRFRDEMSGSLHISKKHCETLFTRFVSSISAREKEIFSSLALDDFYCGRGIVID
jgi:FMN phosphatase YigB (HAD superfamily)